MDVIETSDHSCVVVEVVVGVRLAVLDLPVRYESLELVVGVTETVVDAGQYTLVDARPLLSQKSVKPIASRRTEPDSLSLDDETH
ncbi:hypothetical protein W7S_08605 [Mycobacterium sp. MOTT36Y]|nr:hypothetical protein W7S_08605 [Mycobacterium sp. MOTT36Y]